MPGVFSASVGVDAPVWLTAGTNAFSGSPEEAWNRHFESIPSPYFSEPLLEHLRRECGRFLITTDGEPVVPAGYHWFGPWGRDTLISLPGLTFCSGRIEEGRAVLRQIRSTVRDGLVPNLIGAGYGTPSYNSADASLWYMLAVHRFALAFPGEKAFIKKECWPVIKEIIAANEKAVNGYLAGEEKNLTFLIGQSMRALKGKADHQVVRQTLIDLLNGMK